MTLDRLEELACQAGKQPLELEHWTWGEVLTFLEGRAEERRQQLQCLSVIAFQTARLTAGFLAGETTPQVYERFPFWTEEEKKNLELARYRSMMERLSTGKGKKVKE